VIYNTLNSLMAMTGFIVMLVCIGGIIVELCAWSNRNAEKEDKQACEQCGLLTPVSRICGVGRAGRISYRVCPGCLGNLKRSRQNA